MNTMDIANRLVDLCKQGKDEEALKTLYTDDAVSVEAGVMPGMDREAKGKAAIKAKGEWWRANHELHSMSVTGPWPHDNKFIVGFQIDVTNKPSGQRMQMDEAGLYTVKDGKIIREEFFYAMGYVLQRALAHQIRSAVSARILSSGARAHPTFNMHR